MIRQIFILKSLLSWYPKLAAEQLSISFGRSRHWNFMRPWPNLSYCTSVWNLALTEKQGRLRSRRCPFWKVNGCSLLDRLTNVVMRKDLEVRNTMDDTDTCQGGGWIQHVEWLSMGRIAKTAFKKNLYGEEVLKDLSGDRNVSFEVGKYKVCNPCYCKRVHKLSTIPLHGRSSKIICSW